MSWLKEIKVNFANTLALVVILLCFAYFFYISSSKFPAAMIKDIGDIKIAMITTLTMIVGYYFGSSKSKQQQPVEQK